MIIDCHCHLGKGDGFTDPWNTDAPLEPYFSRARAAGIDKTVVFAPSHSDYWTANAHVARLTAKYPDRYIGFAFVHPARDKGRIYQMVEQAIVEWGFRGIKAHRADAPLTRETCEVARAFRVPILYDIGGQTGIIEMVAPQYPDVDFIVPHLGSFVDDFRAHVQLIDQLVRFPNVYADTSTVRRFDYLIHAVKRAGAHKLLFGTDSPFFMHPSMELFKIRLLNLQGGDEALVLGGNLRRLIDRT